MTGTPSSRRTVLVTEAADLLGADAAPVVAAVESLLATGDVVLAMRDGEDEPGIALAPFARAESGLASRLHALSGIGARAAVARIFTNVDWTVAFGWLADRHRLQLAPEQEAGVRMALTAPVTILTGGPGTGKTHTLRAVLTLARAKGLRCLLAAPTGRAAKRMEEATGWPASTLHRLLELRPGGQAGRNPETPARGGSGGRR